MKKIRYSSKMNALFALLIVLVLGIAFFFNAVTLVLSNRYPLSIDLNANAAYEIGEETRAMLEGLTEEVVIYVLATEDMFDGSAYTIQARSILNQYPKYSRYVTLQYVDSAQDPSVAARFADLTLSEGDILVTAKDNVQQILLSNLFNYTYSATTGGLVIESSRAEEAVTSAIANVLSDHTVRLGVLTGNGVKDMSVLVSLLRDNGYEVEEISLLTGDFSQYDGLMLFAPTVDLSEDVLVRLDEFLYNGGEYGKTLLYTADATQAELPNTETFLREWGVVVGDGAVFETTAERTYGYQPYYPVVAYAEEELSGKLKDQNTPFLSPLAKPLRLLFSARDTRYTQELLSFYETAGVRPSDADDQFTASQAEIWGPMPAMVLASVRVYGTSGVTQSQSNLLVSASTEAFSSTALQNSSVSNMEYLLNLFNDLFEREDAVKIESKSLSKATLGVTTQQANFLGALLAGVIPGLILVAGIVVFLVRRYK